MTLVTSASKSLYLLRNYASHPSYSSPEETVDKVILVDSTVLFPTLPKGIPIDVSSYEDSCRTPQSLGWPISYYRTLLDYESYLLHEHFAHNLRLVTPKDPMQVIQTALHNPLFFLLRKPHSDGTEEFKEISRHLVLDLSILQSIEHKEGTENLGTRTYLKRNKHDATLKIVYIQSGNTVIKPNDKNFCKAVSMVLSGATALLSMRDHLFYTHLLAAGSVWCLAARYLPKSHWLYQILHPHIYAVNRVNARKGIGLMEVFENDFSFTSKGVKELVEIAMKEFKLSNFHPSNLVERIGKETCEVSSMWVDSNRMWGFITEYVNEWFAEGVISQYDKPVEKFVYDVLHLPYDMKLECKTPTDYVKNLIIHILYLAIFYHDAVGDSVKPLIRVMLPWIPKEGTKETIRQQLISKALILLVYWEATIHEYQLSDNRWIRHLPIWIQSSAKKFQKNVSTIHKDFEVGVNK